MNEGYFDFNDMLEGVETDIDRALEEMDNLPASKRADLPDEHEPLFDEYLDFD